MDHQLRAHPSGNGELQQLENAIWIDVCAWLVPSSTPGDPPELRFLGTDIEPPQGSRRLPRPVDTLFRMARPTSQPAIASAIQLDTTTQLVLDCIALLEPDDRVRWFLDHLVPLAWRTLQLSGHPASIGESLDKLLQFELITTRCDHDDELVRYEISEALRERVHGGMAPGVIDSIVNVAAQDWAARFTAYEATPSASSVRAGIAAGVYGARVGKSSWALELLEQRVLPAARQTGETAPVLWHIQRLRRKADSSEPGHPGQQLSAPRNAAHSDASQCLLKLMCVLEREHRTEQLLREGLPNMLSMHELTQDAPSFEHVLEQLHSAGIVKRLPHVERLELDPAAEAEQRAQIDEREYAWISNYIGTLYLQRYKASRTAPYRDSVQSGIACATYGRRVGQHEAMFKLLSTEVLDIACWSGEANAVLAHMQLTAATSRDRELIGRCDEKVRWLAEAHLAEGHAEEALVTAQHGLDFATEHQLGPLSHARWHKLRLECLYALGRNRDVLSEYPTALASVVAVPAGNDSAALKEAMLHIAVGAAKGLRQWQRALDLSAQLRASVQSRGGSAAELARYEMYDAAALMELGQLAVAEVVLSRCQAELADDAGAVATILGERGILASLRGDSAAALALKLAGLQKNYEHSRTPRLALAHENYGNELTRQSARPDGAAAHWFAAALLHRLSGNAAACAAIVERVRANALERAPSSLAEAVAAVERTSRVSFQALLADAGQRGAHPAQRIAEELLASMRKG